MMIAIALLGIGLLAGGIWNYQKTKKFIETGVTTQGKIIRVEEQQSTSTDEDGYTSTSTSYYPILEFIDRSGKKNEFKAKVGVGNKRKWKIDSELDILYDPQQPTNASIKSFGQLWFTTMILFFFAAIMIVTAVMTK